MKIRNGFVSNSSSSSFIIKVDNFKNMPLQERLEEINILRDEFEDPNYEQYVETIKNEDVRILYFDINYGYEEDFSGMMEKLGIDFEILKSYS